MQEQSKKIKDLLDIQYEDFITFCDLSGKVYPYELTNIDFVAYRTYSGKSREYVNTIKGLLDGSIINNEQTANNCAVDLTENAVAAIVKIKHDVSDTFNNNGNAICENSEPVLEECPSELNKRTVIGNETSIYDVIESDSSENIYEDDSEEEARQLEDHVLSTEEQDHNGKRIRKDDKLAFLFDVDASLFDDVNVAQLDLSVRPTNCLANSKIETIAELLSYTIDELFAINNMGRKSVNEILYKLRDYVSDAATINDLRVLESEKPVGDAFKLVDLTPSFNTAVENLLMGNDTNLNELTEAQAHLFTQLKDAIDILGNDICFKAYYSPENSLRVSNALQYFATPYIYHLNALWDVEKRINTLSEDIKGLRLVPFIYAYSVRSPKLQDLLLPNCQKTTTIAQIPFLYKRFKDEHFFAVLKNEIVYFLEWLNFDTNSLVSEIFESISRAILKRNKRALDILKFRLKGETLEEIGARYGVTRERIRQIEKKAYKSFWGVFVRQKYDLIMLVYALRNGDNVLYYDELKETIGGEFATVLWACIKQNPVHDLYYYSKVLDALVIKTDLVENMTEETILSTISDLLSTLPDVMLKPEKESLLNDLIDKNTVPNEIILKVFNSIYRQTGQFYHKGRITVIYMCEYILKHYFPAGYKIADSFESTRFKQYMVEVFGDRAKTITHRAIDADVGRIGILCDRGKYIHPDYLNVEQEIIDAVNSYIEDSPRSLLPYGELFDGMKGTFDGTQITNKYLLQGALKKYGCRFSTGRDFVRKTKSVTFVEELESFVADRGVVHKSEIFAEFTSLGEAGLGQVVARSANVFNIDNGYYIHANQFDIQPQDYESLRNYLYEACKDIPVNIRAVHDVVIEKYPEFMYRNDFEDRNKLFAALNYMFRSEFNFSRPYIAKLGVSDISNRSVILQHIEDYDSIEIEELINICDENNINYVATAYLCQMLAPDFIRINGTTLMRRELTGVTDEIIDQANSIICDLLKVNGYVVASKVSDFLWYPQIDVDWNEFLLENLVVQSKQINVIYMFGDPLKRPNAIYVADEFSKDTFDSFLIKILTEEVHKGSFTSKIEMRDWLREEGMIEVKLPNFLESAKYFYVNETGVHCTGE